MNRREAKLSARQARAARAALGFSIQKLSEKSTISESSIRRLENERDRSVTVDLGIKMRKFYEAQGIEFEWTADDRTSLGWMDQDSVKA